jgi:large subunit ribosomal protein L3
MSASPARVQRGKKMPGQMGNARVTLQNLEIVEVRPEQNIILVKGAIPGANQGLVLIRKCIKSK